MINEYEEDLRIDDSALDVEWLNQPSLMLKYTSKQAFARKEVDRLKELVSVTRAELDRDIRSDPDTYDIDKVTEAAITNSIIMQRKYKDVVAELNEAQYELAMASAAVTSIDHKKAALENLSRLLALNYFSGPSVPRNLNNEVAKRRQDFNANKNVKISRRK